MLHRFFWVTSAFFIDSYFLLFQCKDGRIERRTIFGEIRNPFFFQWPRVRCGKLAHWCSDFQIYALEDLFTTMVFPKL